MELLIESERSELQQHERTIEQGLKTFVDVGNALLAIRDKRLYRKSPPITFEEYCQERWSLERRRAYQLIDAAVVVNNITDDVKNFSHRESHVAPRYGVKLGVTC